MAAPRGSTPSHQGTLPDLSFALRFLITLPFSTVVIMACDEPRRQYGSAPSVASVVARQDHGRLSRSDVRIFINLSSPWGDVNAEKGDSNEVFGTTEAPIVPRREDEAVAATLRWVHQEDVYLTTVQRCRCVPLAMAARSGPCLASRRQQPQLNDFPTQHEFDSVLSLVRRSHGALMRRPIVEREDVDDGHLTAFFRRMDVSAWVPARRGQGPCVCVGRLYCV